MSPSGQREWVAFGVAGLLALAGCAAPSSSPLAPASHSANSPDTLLIQPQISAITEAGIFADAPFAAVDISLDLATGQAEILPVRLAQAPPPVGQKFVVDLTGVMTGDLGCPDCLKITGLRFDPQGRVAVDLSLRHPIAAPNLSQGIGTASLHVNNVRGFVVSRVAGPDGIIGTADDPDLYTPSGLNMSSPIGFDEDLQSVIAGLLANADGYSRDITPLIAPGFDTLYPYIVFGADDGSIGTGSFGPDGWIGAELQNPSGYNVFGQGSTINGSLLLDLNNPSLGTSQVTFRFVLTASYVVARKYFGGVQGSKLDPLYFMPEGALMSPWRVTTHYLGTDGLGGLPREGTTDLAQVEVRIRDWQKAIGTSNTVPALTETTSPTGLLGPSRPKTLAVDIPGITSAPVTYSVLDAPHDGTEANPILQVVSIANNPAAAAGSHVGFIAVYDERSNGPIFGTGESFELYETGGANRDLAPFNLTSGLRSYVTYQLFNWEVGDIGAHAVLDNAIARVNGRIVLDARGSFVDAPATSITEFAYVLGYGGDPTEFTTPDIVTTAALHTAAHSLPAGPVEVGLRVTSNLGDQDITTYSLDVAPARDPFGTPDALIQMHPTPYTNLRFGVQGQDFTDLSNSNPVGGDNLIALGDRLYVVFYGNTGLPNPGLHILRSLDGGTTWQAPTELISAANPSFTQYGGASITGAQVAGQDRVVVALGTISYLTSGTGRILVFENTNAATGTSWTQTQPESYALSASQSGAVSPAIAMNPLNPSEIHLVYGTDTGGATNGILRRWRVRSSTSGVAGLSSGFQTIDGTAGDSGWLTDTGSSWCTELAVHPLTGRTFMLLGLNRWSYVLRTDDAGASWMRPLVAHDHGATFYREGDLVMDPWRADEYVVVRARRGAQFADPFIRVLRGAGVTLTAVDPQGARSAADMGFGAFDTLSAHAALALHGTGELEIYWTEALGPGGGPGTYTNGPHLQMDMSLPTVTNFLYDPDRTINGTSTGMNPSVEVASDGRVHTVWQDSVAGRLYYRRG
ncbi:MAG: hypothetical protein GEEBNDBF_00870 [bacterium]|nr:hypothetical protein [bacterium]